MPLPSERAGVVATTTSPSADQLVLATSRCPWRGPLVFTESAHGSTIAATGSAQVADQGRWVAAVHGRVTNAEEVANRLDLGSADSATVVAGAMAAPVQRPSMLEGSFAGVVLDRHTGEVRAVRSFSGGRPLACTSVTGDVALATEPEVAAALLGIGGQIDHDALDRYVEGKMLSTETFLRHTRWLIPGSWLVAERGQVTVSVLDVTAPLIDRPHGAVVETVTEAIDAAVARAIDGAGIIASMATGGLDSSSLVGFAAQHRPVEVAITTRVKAAALSADETDLAASTVRPLVGRHHIIDLEPGDLFDGIEDWVPILGPPGFLIVGLLIDGYKAAVAHGSDLVLDGLGGDQVFSINPVREAVAESAWGRLPRAVLARRRGAIRPLVSTAVHRLAGSQRRPVVLPQRVRERALYTDAQDRNQVAAVLDLRLELPYLDAEVMKVGAGVPPASRLPRRQLQREAVAKVVPHADTSIKALYADCTELHFALEGAAAYAAARRFFADRWSAALAGHHQ